MTITLNGETRELESPCTVAQLLDVLRLGRQRGVAVARNGDVVLRAAWASTQLDNGDRVEVLHAVQGG